MAVHPIFYIQRFVCLFFYLFLNFFIIIFKIKFPWSLRNVFPKKTINCWCLTTPRSPLFPLQVKSCFLVVEPRTRVSRGFAFVTMETVEDASRCVKYLNQSVLEGRYITVERVIDYSFRGKTLTILISLLHLDLEVFWLYSEHIASAMLAAINQRWWVHPYQLYWNSLISGKLKQLIKCVWST